MIEVRQLVKRYGRRFAVKSLSFEARTGEITLLVGANGAGKSTSMKILAGLIKRYGGYASIHGRDLKGDRRQALSTLAYLPQGPRFHPRMTPRHILQFYARIRMADKSRIAVLSEECGLAEFLEKPISTLSGGQCQRLGTALLFLPDAPVLLLDEPDLSLDPIWLNKLQIMLNEEAKSGKTILVCTHMLSAWEGRADRCIYLREGGNAVELDTQRLHSAYQLEAYEQRQEFTPGEEAQRRESMA